MMGVIEDLSDYYWVMKKLVTLIKPGGRINLDFATSNKRFSTSVFITKYIWPGTFRMVYLPEFVDAINKLPFEINSMYNDRFNYYYWTWLMQRCWVENKAEVFKKINEFTWRLFNILFVGTSAIESTPSYAASAYRVVLELPADHNALSILDPIKSTLLISCSLRELPDNLFQNSCLEKQPKKVSLIKVNETCYCRFTY